MPSKFSPLPGARGWQLSNPSVLDVVSLYSSLVIYEEAGKIQPRRAQAAPSSDSQPPILVALREKSLDLTAYLEFLLRSSSHFLEVDALKSNNQGVSFTIITPSGPSRRGAQLSLLFEPVEAMDAVFEALRQEGVLGDERRPGVIRFAPVPLYNSWADCAKAASVLERVLDGMRGVVERGAGGEEATKGEIHLG